MYEVWTLDDHSLSYEDYAYEFVETLDELDYPLIHYGKEFYF